MKKKLGKLITAWTLLFALLAVPASSHESSYCGHGTDGILELTIYLSSKIDSFAHYHNRVHGTTIFGVDGFLASQHYDTKVCGAPTMGHF